MRRILEIASWALYDFANTIYAINIVSYHFPLWLTLDKGLKDWQFGCLMALASLVAALTLPWIGFISDRANSRHWPVVFLTLCCVVFTAGMGLTHSILGVYLLFVISHSFFQSAQVPYNAHLIHFKQGQRGWISGSGVAIGYVGTMVGVSLTRPIQELYGHQAVFLPTAILFLVFALPHLCIAPGGEKINARGFKRIMGSMQMYPWSRLKDQCLESIPLRYFAVASFFILNVTSVLIFFMTIFARQAASLSPSETHIMILLSSIGAMSGALSCGVISDRMDSYRAMRFVYYLWMMGLLLLFGYRWKPLFLLASMWIGFALGGTWTVSRVYLTSVVPEHHIGEIFGVFGLLGRMSMITGPLIASIPLKLLDAKPYLKYDLFLAVLCVLAFVGYHYLRKTGDHIDETPESAPIV